jgi:hypothetical protein
MCQHAARNTHCLIEAFPGEFNTALNQRVRRGLYRLARRYADEYRARSRPTALRPGTVAYDSHHRLWEVDADGRWVAA